MNNLKMKLQKQLCLQLHQKELNVCRLTEVKDLYNENYKTLAKFKKIKINGNMFHVHVQV